MKRLVFLPTTISYGLLALTLAIFWKYPFIYFVITALIVSVVFFFSRRAFIPYRDTLKNEGEIYLSPVHGEIKSIRLNVPTLNDPHPHHEVRFTISNFNEKGLYLPTTGEVAYLRATKGVKIPRDSEGQAFYRPIDEVSHTDLTLMSKNKTHTLLRFIDCKYGKRPTIWLKSGDRGRGAACFGYYPFGGTLIIYLPHNSDILVFENERVVPGQTVIAAIKDVNKDQSNVV
jgi:hypothetical protein